nr:hypothetical protein CFP56_58589 [Quercus suber]
MLSDPFLQSNIPTSQNDAAEATSFTIALIPCAAFLLDLGGTAVLATLTISLMLVVYVVLDGARAYRKNNLKKSRCLDIDPLGLEW